MTTSPEHDPVRDDGTSRVDSAIGHEFDVERWRVIRNAVQLEFRAIIPFVVAPLLLPILALGATPLVAAAAAVLLHIVPSGMIFVARRQAGRASTGSLGRLATTAAYLQILSVASLVAVIVMLFAKAPAIAIIVALAAMVIAFLIGVIVFCGHLRHIAGCLRRGDIARSSVWAMIFASSCGLYAIVMAWKSSSGVGESEGTNFAQVMMLLTIAFLVAYGRLLRRISRALQ